MLIHAHDGPFCWRNYFVTSPTVTLDGVEQKDVIAADDEKGRIVRYKRGPDGNLVAKDDRYDVEVVRGAVIITGQRKMASEDRLARAQTKRERRGLKRAEIARRQQICGE